MRGYVRTFADKLELVGADGQPLPPLPAGVLERAQAIMAAKIEAGLLNAFGPPAPPPAEKPKCGCRVVHSCRLAMS